MAGPGRKLAIAHSPQLERQLLERLARDGQLIDYLVLETDGQLARKM
jgi:hypothetical protein